MDGWPSGVSVGFLFYLHRARWIFSVANHGTPTAYGRKDGKTGARDMGIDWPEPLNPPIRTPEPLSLFPIFFTASCMVRQTF